MKIKYLLNNINGYKLDKDQKKAILSDNEYTMIIAGAGSGKTLTIIGKIRYLIEIEHLKESEILCISFTNEATNSLKEKLISNYNYKNIDVKTFHKISLDILKKHNYKIVPDNYLEELIKVFFEDIIYNSDYLIKRFLKYFKVYYTKKNYLNKYQKLINQNSHYSLINKIKLFVKAFKANDNSLDFFKENLKRKNTYNLLIIIYAFYLYYESELFSLNMIDFDDMLKYAIINIDNMPKKYKYIIVDEFQDTSLLRYKLLKKLVDHHQAKLMVVGDDYQSIYRFNGCNLEIFLSFKNYFFNCQILYLNKTYRNSLEIISVANQFIMKNKKQVKKDLTSSKTINKPIKYCFYKNMSQDFSDLIFNLSQVGDLLILGRNNTDIKKYLDFTKFKLDDKGYLVFNKQTHIVRYLTIHKSKGLEADNVIIINLEDSKYSLPAKREEEPIFKYFGHNKTDFLYDEERRLFYVALTRTKNCCYLFLNKYNVSCFVKELKKDSKKYIEIIKK